MQQHVTRSHTAAPYDQYAKVTAGEKVTYLNSDDRNPMWFKGRTRDGVEGFFPLEDFNVDPSRTFATCLRSYDATELSVFEGDVVEPLGCYGDWLQVHFNGQIGWIPENCCQEVHCFAVSA